MSEMKYKEIDGIFYPDIEAGVDPLIIPGMYARKRLEYIREYSPALEMELTLTNELNEYLQKIQDEADEMEDRIERQLKAASGIKEEWKNTDTLRWVQEMNQIRHQAREIVYRELIYV